MQNGVLNGLDEPIAAIKVKVGLSEYEPRWSFYAEYLLSNRGLTLQDILSEANARGPKLVSLMMELLSACVAHHYPAGAAPTAASLASQLTQDQVKPMIAGLYAAGRAAGAIVDVPKNGQTPADQLAQPTETLKQ